MSAIARVLLKRGFQVSGSDLHRNTVTAALQELGAVIFQGHAASNIAKADVLVVTSAVAEDHIEIVTAQKQGIPVYKRQDMIAALMRDKVGIAIAGTHGKTTTTSMIAHILIEAGHAPSYIVGGVMSNTGTNADVGGGPAFVIEADEYDNMFLGLQPQLAVLTSVEFDHPDFFKTPHDLREAFAQFVALLPQDGLLIVYADDAAVLKFAAVHPHTMTYGIDNLQANWRAEHIHYAGVVTSFDVLHQDIKLGTVQLGIPGQHNILNALAALIVAQHEGVSFTDAAKALATFKGSGRRFDVRADVNGIAIIDDYAHHPTAIRATIDAARKRYPDREIWVIWQPHTYSRTQQLWHDFLLAFVAAHHLIVTEIYAARERYNPAVSARDFVAALHHVDAQHAPTFADAVAMLVQHVQAPAAIIIMSAGDAPQIGVDYLNVLRKPAS